MTNDEKEKGPPFEYRTVRRRRVRLGRGGGFLSASGRWASGPPWPLPGGTDDFPSRIKERGRSMMWLGGAIAVIDVFGSLLLGSLGIDIYWQPIRMDVAVGCIAVFLVGFGILMQVWDSTPHDTSIDEE